MGRKLARTTLMQCLYMLEVTSDSSEEVLAAFREEHPLGPGDKPYFDEGVQYIQENQEKIDKLILHALEGWSISRLAKVDISIMRVAIFEMLHMEDVPIEVSINEAVNLAKSYSTEESYRFINGVLGGVAKRLNTEEEA